MCSLCIYVSICISLCIMSVYMCLCKTNLDTSKIHFSICRAYDIMGDIFPYTVFCSSLQDINRPMIVNKNPRCHMLTTLLFITSAVCIYIYISSK